MSVNIQSSMAVDSLIINKRMVPLEENSCKRNYFIDGKYSMKNFNTTDLPNFHGRKTIHAQEKYC